MNVVDVNVLLYAVNRRSTRHQQAHDWLTRQLVGTGAVGFAWTALLGFVRIGTSRSILPNPITSDQAFDTIDAWLAAPAAVIVEPTVRHRAILRGLLAGAGTAGNLTNDAHLAALAVEYGGAVATFDRDFERFDVDVVIPQ
ncbi:MAG: TA system VapC family ribonuclease toxin [Trebonia sp.]